LGERVLESCATKLKPYLVQAVKSLGVPMGDYSLVLSSICQDTSDALEKNDTCVTSEHTVSFLLVICLLIFETFHDKRILKFYFCHIDLFQEDKGELAKRPREESAHVWPHLNACFLHILWL